jgi:hypothetical protein
MGLGYPAAVSLSIPTYVCGCGNRALLSSWLEAGMVMGTAIAFMVLDIATKLTNWAPSRSFSVCAISRSIWAIACYLPSWPDFRRLDRLRTGDNSARDRVHPADRAGVTGFSSDNAGCPLRESRRKSRTTGSSLLTSMMHP